MQLNVAGKEVRQGGRNSIGFHLMKQEESSVLKLGLLGQAM